MPKKNNELCTKKHQKHTVCSFRYTLVCVDDKFSKSLNSCLGKYSSYNFINSMIEESKYCCDVMKKHFYKNLVMTKKDDKDFKNSAKCRICNNVYVKNDIKARDHCQINSKCRGSAYKNCKLNV